MRDAIVLALSIALPSIAGTLAIRAAIGRSAQPAAITIGYGYLAGMFAVTLVMRALSLAGLHWSVAWIAAPIALIALAAYFLARARRYAATAINAIGAAIHAMLQRTPPRLSARMTSVTANMPAR